MGLFDVIGDAFGIVASPAIWAAGKAGEAITGKNPVSAQQFFGGLSELTGGHDKPGQGMLPNAPTAPNVDPRYGQIQGAQQAQGEAFRANIPGQEESLAMGAGEAGRTNLAHQLTDINRTASSRGLLYGGGRLAARAGARGQLATALAGNRAGINQNVLNTANQMDIAPINTGFGMAGAGAQHFGAGQEGGKAQAEYEAAQREQTGKTMGQVGQAIGAGAGIIGNKIFGKKYKNDETSPSEYKMTPSLE